MFVTIQFESEDKLPFYEPVNIFYIQQIEYVDVTDIDLGCLLKMKDGRELFTPETMDILKPRLDDYSRQYCSILLSQVAAETQANIMKEQHRRKIEATHSKPTKKKKVK